MKKEKKEVRFQMLMSQEEKIVLKEMADRYGVSMGFFLRYLIRLHALELKRGTEYHK